LADLDDPLCDHLGKRIAAISEANSLQRLLISFRKAADLLRPHRQLLEQSVKWPYWQAAHPASNVPQNLQEQPGCFAGGTLKRLSRALSSMWPFAPIYQRLTTLESSTGAGGQIGASHYLTARASRACAYCGEIVPWDDGFRARARMGAPGGSLWEKTHPASAQPYRRPFKPYYLAIKRHLSAIIGALMLPSGPLVGYPCDDAAPNED
jgi:hypothetical protein